MSDIQELEQKNKELNEKYSKLVEDIGKVYITVELPSGTNRNGRTYTPEVFKKSVEEYKKKQMIMRRSFVSIEDPNDTPGTISLDNVVAVIEDIKEFYSEIKVKLKFLDTDKSKVVQKICAAGSKMRITPRMSPSEEIVDFQLSQQPGI